MEDQRETTSFQISVLITISLITPTLSPPLRLLLSTSSLFQRPPRPKTLEFHQSTRLHFPTNLIPMSSPPLRTRRLPLAPSDKSGLFNGQND